MLSNLQIENIAIIKNAVIDFNDGFNVMTGETGAGKSIIIDSLNAVLGERTSRELIRTGCDFASVSAVFYDKSDAVNSVLSELDIMPEDDGSVIISRKITADGKNNCKINGVSVTVSNLKKIGSFIVNIHGQLDNQALLNPEFHMSYIDSIADNASLIEKYRESYNEYTETLKALEKLNVDEEQKMRRLDTLSYQIKEIENAHIVPGEYASLKEKQSFYRNAEKLTAALNSAYEALNGNSDIDGAVSLSFAASNKLNSCADMPESVNELSKRIEESAYNLSDCADELGSVLDSLEFDESDVNFVEERLALIHDLSRKYGKTEEDIIEYYNNAVSELDSIENADELKIKLEKELKEKYRVALENAKELSKSRIFAGNSFCLNVCEELKFLNMPNVKFFVEINPTELNENGIDTVEFFLSANAGEAPKPLHKIASGGELSRIMLAIKSVLAEKDNIGTLVFDEIDTGVSGSAAQKIAIKLKSVSSSHQVICVTHLAQIAAYADEQLLIEKAEKDGHTFTSVRSLKFDERKQELARIMGGMTITQSLIDSAEHMLNDAQNKS